ncbi:MAG TPA: hypothetical protein VN408_17320 [Actinoplanes sp.]|nr:hypothetical protein [Actinoplanes sp.]
MTSVVGLPAPVGAAPPPPPSADQTVDKGGKGDHGGKTGPAGGKGDKAAEGGKDPKRLKKALLTEADVPKGFVVKNLPHIDQMFSGMVGSYRTNADPCAAPPPAKGGKAEEIRSATALFLHEKKSVAVVEMLAVTGPEVAADMVTDTETVLDECPVTKSPGAELEMEPLDWNPILGDESITVGMRFQVKEDDVELTMLGKMAFVAYRDLSLTVGLIGVKEPSDRDFKNVVRAAVRKVVLNTPVSTKSRR